MITWDQILHFRTAALSFLQNSENEHANKSKFGMLLINKIRETDKIVKQYRDELNMLSLKYATEQNGVINIRDKEHEIFGLYYHAKNDLQAYLMQLAQLDTKWDEKEFPLVQMQILDKDIPEIPDISAYDINPFIKVIK